MRGEGGHDPLSYSLGLSVVLTLRLHFRCSLVKIEDAKRPRKGEE